MDTHSRIDAALEQALERDTADRSNFMAALRASDPDVASEVEQLLVAHELSAGILDRVAVNPSGSARLERHIGPYRVVRELGRGGMGVVYLAERDDGQFRRRVAVKLLRNSPDAEELHHRFLAERQILASLVHPNIAQLIDGGVTDGRLPYLVMEYVEGWPITEYCDRHRLGVDQRLRLFQSVCAAVHHAHSNLVIHRDLKPCNILVTHDGQVKLLDFGIAKLLNPGLGAVATPVTWTAHRVLTPEYASPEQLRGEPLSTTSDVYSLGVVLYELLAGCRPHAAPGTALPELAARISEQDPERPSMACVRCQQEQTDPEAAVAAVSAAREATPQHLQRTLRGDIDAIVLMALRKEPTRRYGSVDLLAQDVQRYLEGLPVLAHQGSRSYYMRKFVRRHRLAVSAAAMVALSLIGGAGVALRQTAIAHNESARTQAALREAEEVTEFLVSMFEVNDPEQLRGQEVTARDLLRRGMQRAEELHAQPVVQARMLDVISRVFHGLGDYAQSRVLLERALRIREADFGSEHVDVARTLEQLAQTLRMLSRYAEAEVAAQRALDIRTRVLGPEHADVATSLLQVAGMAVYRADLDRALTLVRRAVFVREKAFGADDPILAPALLTLGSILGRRGEYEEAEQHLRRAVDITRSVGSESAEFAGALLGLAYILREIPSRSAEAESLFREGLQKRRDALGPDHPLYAAALGDLAVFLRDLGRYAEAIEAGRQHLDLEIRLLGADHPRVAEIMGGYALTLHSAGRSSEAIEQARTSADLRARAYGTEHVSYAAAISDLAVLLGKTGHTAEAERLLRQAIAIRHKASGRESGVVANIYAELATIQLKAGQLADAERSILHALRIFQDQRIRPSQKDHQNALVIAAELYEARGDSAAALRYRRMLAP